MSHPRYQKHLESFENSEIDAAELARLCYNTGVTVSRREHEFGLIAYLEPLHGEEPIYLIKAFLNKSAKTRKVNELKKEGKEVIDLGTVVLPLTQDGIVQAFNVINDIFLHRN